jgi:UDP-glucose 4-epimerase
MIYDNPKTALVTGATGFLGRRLCVRLRERGWRVIGVARRVCDGAPWDDCIIHSFGSGEPLLVPAAPDAVFHLAARTHATNDSLSDEEPYAAVNVRGMVELSDAMSRWPGAKIVFASSVKAHGEETPREGVDESSADNPKSPYGRTKLEAEQLLKNSVCGSRAVVLRFPMIFGPGQKGNLQELIRAIDARRLPPIPDTGNLRSMLHVDDAVFALVSAAERRSSEGRTYYVSPPHAYSARELYVMISQALGRRVPRWTVPAWLLRDAARIGDAVGAMRGKRFVWDTDRYTKLFGSAHYIGTRAGEDLAFPSWTLLEQALPETLSASKAGCAR